MSIRIGNNTLRLRDKATGVMREVAMFGSGADASLAEIGQYAENAKNDVIQTADAKKAELTTVWPEGSIEGVKNMESRLAKCEENCDLIGNYVTGIHGMSNWRDVRLAVDNNLVRKMVSVGDIISDRWTDTKASREYDIEWHVADFQDAILEDGSTVPGMQLQWHWATPVWIQFSQCRAFLACPDGLDAGTYTIKFARTWGNFVDLVWHFTIASPVPAGGKLAGFRYLADSAKTAHTVYVYSADGKSVLETVTATVGEEGTVLGTLQYDRRDGNLNSMQETGYGWNRWKTSAVRQYLNSDAVAGEWWVAQDEWDIAPDQLTQKDGFLRGVPSDLLEAIKTTKVVTHPNTVNDDPANNAPDITYDKIFLPSLSQMFIQEQKAGEGEPWAYWKSVRGSDTRWAHWNTYPELKHYAVENKSSAQSVRLRSANRGFAKHTWHVNSSGSINHGNAGHANRFAPACVI